MNLRVNLLSIFFLVTSIIGLIFLAIISCDLIGLNKVLITSFLGLIGQFYFIYTFKSEREDVSERNFEYIIKSDFFQLIALTASGISLMIMFFELKNERVNESVANFLMTLLYFMVIAFSPAIYYIYTFLRDINDYIKLTENGELEYRDNSTHEKFNLQLIAEVKIAAKGGIQINFKDGTQHIIPTYQMNISDIRRRLWVIRIHKAIRAFN